MLDKENYTKTEVIDMLYELAYVVDEHRRRNWKKLNWLKERNNASYQRLEDRIKAKKEEDDLIYEEILVLIDTIDYGE